MGALSGAAAVAAPVVMDPDLLGARDRLLLLLAGMAAGAIQMGVFLYGYCIRRVNHQPTLRPMARAVAGAVLLGLAFTTAAFVDAVEPLSFRQTFSQKCLCLH